MCGTRALKLVRWIARPPNLNPAPLLQMEMQLKPKPIEERDNTPRLYRITISEPRAPHWPMSTHVNFRHEIERAEAKKNAPSHGLFLNGSPDDGLQFGTTRPFTAVTHERPSRVSKLSRIRLAGSRPTQVHWAGHEPCAQKKSPRPIGQTTNELFNRTIIIKWWACSLPELRILLLRFSLSRKRFERATAFGI